MMTKRYALLSSLTALSLVAFAPGCGDDAVDEILDGGIVDDDPDTDDPDTDDPDTDDPDTDDPSTDDPSTDDPDTDDPSTDDPSTDGGPGNTDAGTAPDSGVPPDGGAQSDSGAEPDAGMGDAGADLGFPQQAVIGEAALPSGFVAWQWADTLAEPRGMIVDNGGNVLVVEQDANWVSALWDDDGDGVSGPMERQVIAEAPGLNHGIVLMSGHLYASSDTTVYRWEYTPRMDLGPGEAVINGIPGGGRHTTRTLLADSQYLYVSVGTAGNVDPDSSRSRVVRFELSELSSVATPFSAGEVFADGLRNEVGLALDAQGRVWGVENGLDELYDADLGGDIHDTNPGEDVDLFEQPGAFYGHPYCWTEYQIENGQGRGTQWAFEGTAPDAGPPFDAGAYSDSWCQDEGNVVPPILVLPAHSAPLDIMFYPAGSFPDDYNGDALVTLHGSWNAEPPVGYKVIRIPFGSDGMPAGTWEPLFEFAGPGDTGANWNERPVDLALLPTGTVLVTSDDDSDRVIAIDYRP